MFFVLILFFYLFSLHFPFIYLSFLYSSYAIVFKCLKIESKWFIFLAPPAGDDWELYRYENRDKAPQHLTPNR